MRNKSKIKRKIEWNKKGKKQNTKSHQISVIWYSCSCPNIKAMKIFVYYYPLFRKQNKPPILFVFLSFEHFLRLKWSLKRIQFHCSFFYHSHLHSLLLLSSVFFSLFAVRLLLFLFWVISLATTTPKPHMQYTWNCLSIFLLLFVVNVYIFGREKIKNFSSFIHFIFDYLQHSFQCFES